MAIVSVFVILLRQIDFFKNIECRFDPFARLTSYVSQNDENGCFNKNRDIWVKLNENLDFQEF